jgi:hypothetical protein
LSLGLFIKKDTILTEFTFLHFAVPSQRGRGI